MGVPVTYRPVVLKEEDNRWVSALDIRLFPGLGPGDEPVNDAENKNPP